MHESCDYRNAEYEHEYSCENGNMAYAPEAVSLTFDPNHLRRVTECAGRRGAVGARGRAQSHATFAMHTNAVTRHAAGG